MEKPDLAPDSDDDAAAAATAADDGDGGGDDDDAYGWDDLEPGCSVHIECKCRLIAFNKVRRARGPG